MITCDLHVHPDYSIDAKSSIEQYCHKAMQIGLQVIAFTTHYDTNPIRCDVDPFLVVDGKKVKIDDYAISRYIDDCFVARQKFPELRILIGLEVDYYVGVETEVVRLRSAFPLDFLIGSVHCLDGIAISSRKEAPDYFKTHTMNQMADGYYEMLFNIGSCGLFEVIGHADYYLRYGIEYYGKEIFSVYKNRLDPVIEAAMRTGTGFEVNASQARHNNEYFFPQIDFLKYAVKRGAVINSIGSDAHHVDQLALSINQSVKLLQENGIPLRLFYENS